MVLRLHLDDFTRSSMSASELVLPSTPQTVCQDVADLTNPPEWEAVSRTVRHQFPMHWQVQSHCVAPLAWTGSERTRCVDLDGLKTFS